MSSGRRGGPGLFVQETHAAGLCIELLPSETEVPPTSSTNGKLRLVRSFVLGLEVPSLSPVCIEYGGEVQRGACWGRWHLSQAPQVGLHYSLGNWETH